MPAEGRARAAVPRQGGGPRAAARSQSILPSNQLQIQHALDQVIDTGKKQVGLLGFSFKAGTDDLRESPMVILAEALLGKGYRAAHLRPERLARAAGRREQGLHRGADPAPLAAAVRHHRRGHRRVRGDRRRQPVAGVRGGAGPHPRGSDRHRPGPHVERPVRPQSRLPGPLLVASRKVSLHVSRHVARCCAGRRSRRLPKVHRNPTPGMRQILRRCP